MKFIWLSLAALVVDQASKLIVASWMDLGESVQVLGDFLQITYVHNPGAAFGLRLGGRIFHSIFSVAAMLFVVVLFWRVPADDRGGRISLTLIFGGALGNILDRIRLGEVVDFLDVGAGDLRWPVFNLADAFVTVGVILLIFLYLYRKEGRKPALVRRND